MDSQLTKVLLTYTKQESVMPNGFIVITGKDRDNASEKQQLWWILNTLQQVGHRLWYNVEAK